MPKIDFYVLTTENENQRLEYVCRLVEKAYKNQHRIYIHAADRTMAHQLDELLWTYREDSFLPHNLYGEGPDPAPPIQIGFEKKPETQRDILINLHKTVPDFFMQFARICEVVSSDPECQAISRENYRHYRTHGFEITTHKLQTVEV